MSDYENYLIRKVLHNDRELDLSFLIEATFVETIDLSGPRIMMKFNDQYSLIRDELKVKPGVLLDVRLPAGGMWGEGYDLYAKYRVLTMPVTAKGEVMLNCMLEDVWQWKQPIVKPRIFRGKDPFTIVTELDPFNSRQYQADYFPVTEEYHFLPGERTSLTLKQMANEHAACIYITRDDTDRGKLCVRSKKKMVEAEPMFTYDHYDEDFPQDVDFGPYHGQMLIYAKAENNTILEDMMVRYYTGFSMTDGPIQATKNTQAPQQFMPQKHQITLNNLNTVLVPVAEFTAPENSWLVAGVMMKLNWYQSDKSHPIDESMPPKALVHTVIHYYSAQKPFMRVKLVNLAEWVE